MGNYHDRHPVLPAKVTFLIRLSRGKVGVLILLSFACFDITQTWVIKTPFRKLLRPSCRKYLAPRFEQLLILEHTFQKLRPRCRKYQSVSRNISHLAIYFVFLRPCFRNVPICQIQIFVQSVNSCVCDSFQQLYCCTTCGNS